MGQDPGRGIAGKSEYSWGPGMHPNPAVDYDRMEFPHGPANRAAKGRTRNDQVRDLQAYRRLNATQRGEKLDDMYTAAGNTDRFGAAPPLVQTPARKEPAERMTEVPWRMERRR